MTQPFHLTINVKSRSVALCAATLAVDSPWEGARELIARLLSSPDVQSVQVDRRKATVVVSLTDIEPPVPGIVADTKQQLKDVAERLRQPSEPRYQLSDVYAACLRLSLQKGGSRVTAGSIASAVPGRVRIRHPLLQGQPETVNRVEKVLAQIPGITSIAGSSLTGTVRILFRTGAFTPQKLLIAVERIVDTSSESNASLVSPPVGQWVASGACLALAASAVSVPVMGPIAAAALVCCNLPTLSRGIVELCTFRWKVPSLYTVIMATTLTTGHYLTAALMQALVTGWHAWTSHRLRTIVHELNALPEPSQETQDALFADSIPATPHRQAAGKMIHVPAGTLLPVDGVVVRGEADVDEHGVRGIRTPARRVEGDEVFAGSVVLQGDLTVRVVASDSKTRLSRIRGTVQSLICDAVGTGGATPHGKAVASKFVPFTFATGAAALMVGDVSTLAAVLRPDFSTGPSLTDRLGTLSSISQLLHDGWLVQSCEALHELARVKKVVVFRSSNDQMTLSLNTIPSMLHPVEVHDIAGREADCVDYVQFLCESEQNVAVVASHTVLKQLRQVKVLKISLSPDHCLGHPYVDLIALHGQPQRLSDLLRLLQESRFSGGAALAAVLACNGLAISGALIFGLTSLHVVGITNAGILAAGVLHERRIRRSNALLRSHSLQKSLPAAESFVVIPEESPPPAAEVDDPALQPVIVRHGPNKCAGMNDTALSSNDRVSKPELATTH